MPNEFDLCCAVRSHCGEAGRTGGAGGEPLAVHRHHVAASAAAARRRGSQIVAPSAAVVRATEMPASVNWKGQNWSVGRR